MQPPVEQWLCGPVSDVPLHLHQHLNSCPYREQMRQQNQKHFESLKETIEILREEKKCKCSLWKGKKRILHKKRVKVLIVEESFRLKSAILDYPSVSCSHPVILFKDLQWSALSLQSVYLLSGLLTAKMLGAAQVLRRGPVKQACTGFHPTRVSENKKRAKGF